MRLTRTSDSLLAPARWAQTVVRTTIYVLFAFALVRYTSYAEFTNRGDSEENILNAFLISQGWRAYSDFGNNHFPGVYLYLAPFLKLFGFHDGLQGPELSGRAMLACSFATVFFQVVLFTLAMKLCGLRALFTTVTIAGLSILLYGSWNVHLPMSETYCIGLYALWTVLVYRAVLAPTVRQRFTAAFWLIPLGATATWFGLTQAFANALGALFGAAVMWSARGGLPDARPVRGHVAAGVALCLTLLAATLWRSDIAGLLFYNFEVNLHVNRPVVADQLAAIAQWHLRGAYEIPLLKSLPVLLLLVLVIAWLLVREGRGRRRIAVFGAVVVAAALLTFWREVRDFHAAPILGIQLGLLFLLAGSLRRATWRWRVHANLWRFGREALYLCLGAMLAISVLFSANLRALATHTTPTAIRPAAFEGVCRFADEAACACVRVSRFDALFFLRHDLRPCRGYGFYSELLHLYPPMWGEYLREVQSRRIAYAIFEPLLPIDSFGIDVAREIERNYACRQVGPDPNFMKPFQLCLPPPG
jgi:hypothetical protein